MSALSVTISNQWSGTFSQPASFGTTPPALESVVVALTPANSVGGGSGTPSAGNWLFCLVAMNEQAATAGFTVGVGDDARSFWRPGNETTSTWAVSTASALTRAAVWYTANTATAPGNVYVAPNGAFDALTVLVVEVAGLGPWDTVAGINTNYAAAATSLSLALGAPAAQALIIGAVAGDLSTATQAFAPASWTGLHTVSVTNGSDHTCDSVLTSAYIVTSGSVSVSGTAVSATDLSGVLISVLTSASSPVPAAQNPSWPYLKFEAAFGGGFQTPPDELTWTDLTSRLWSWNETTGVQYQLGSVQATDLTLELDNYDNALASDNTGSPYYSNALNSNMSFESGISPWALTDPSAAQSAVQSSAHAYSGTYSMFVTPTNTGHSVVLSEQVAATVGSVYTASAWFYSPGGWATGGQVQINWYNAGHGYLSTSNTTPTALPAATWTQATLTATAPANTAFAQLVVNESGATTSSNTYYVDEAALVAGSSVVSTGLVTTGTPIRIRAALGTIGGVTVNRWYVIQRNSQEWAQQVDPAYRRRIAATGTDIWSILSSAVSTPYRGEIRQDAPYAWWPCDDQPLTSGVLPTSLRNAAQGNTNSLSIIESPNGTLTSTLLDSNGSAAASTAKAVAVYTVGAQAGWLYGDPQSSPASYQTSNPVTQNPGSAAWQQTGCQGSGGTVGWFLSCNDASFPALSSGVTVEGWYNYQFLGSNTVDGVHNIAQQPSGPLTLWTLTTASLPVAALQLDSSGHLTLITYSGSTPTTNSIYTTTDLRDASWFHVAVTMTTTAWTVYLNGGVTAVVSGSAAGMTSAWSWLLVDGDTGVHGGGNTATIAHVGNASVAHLAVYPSRLPAFRVLAHYCAALTGFGLLPAPQAVSINSFAANGAFFPDGATATTGTYGNVSVGFAFSARAVAVAGSYTSGPSAYAAGSFGADAANGDNVTVTWTGLAERFNVYTATGAGSETQAEVTAANYADFTSGYGGSATSTGVDKISSGSGSSPPASASALGDTVQQRLERILGYGNVTYPGRCIDPAALAVQAATDIGGQQTAANLTNITQSDGGLMAIDNLGNLTYWQKSHLAAQYSSPVWTLTPAAPPTSGAPLTAIPYYREDFNWPSDPQRVWNAILIQPYSPDGSSLADITPSQASQVNASQQQYGAQPHQVTSYLQSQTEMQSQADFLFSNYGQARIRVEGVKVDAAPYPAAFPLVLGVNCGDVVNVTNWQIGGGGNTGTFRVSQIRRVISFGGDDEEDMPRAEVVLTCDYEPPSYWT